MADDPRPTRTIGFNSLIPLPSSHPTLTIPVQSGDAGSSSSSSSSSGITSPTPSSMTPLSPLYQSLLPSSVKTPLHKPGAVPGPVPVPKDTIPINPKLMDQLEVLAARTAADVQRLISTLTDNLTRISQLTSESLKVQQLSLENLHQAALASTEETLNLITKVDELSHNMETIGSLAAQIKAIKDQLDWFEAAVTKT
ncbi:uncharacterized protein BJ171DRAFT_493024 [Polychytrium aggregatum]|uniref:uncharacterized protein n=1 Tax=Polychytrium aggregatum TaxID=110093 RepID=UPI0022FECF64|nr:uncharacterized protein BJ171DRAFT_493024 [Polychytrium aggregatum]KAI9207563.1 hypothetical protein BJ171DRAFT_493024 [Polychytrium aggregatum]